MRSQAECSLEPARLGQSCEFKSCRVAKAFQLFGLGLLHLQTEGLMMATFYGS